MPSQPPQQPQPNPAERSHVPTTAHGRLKLTDWVIGTVPDREAAQACASVLLSAGFADDDVLVEAPTAILQQLREEEAGEQSEGWLGGLLHAVEEAVAGTGAALRAVYVREAQAGRWFVGAHDAQGNQLDRIRNVLVDHGAHNIRLFEPSGVRHLG